MSEFCRNMASKKSDIKWLTIKRVGNNSLKYDDVVHLNDAKHVHPEDATNMSVGKTVWVKLLRVGVGGREVVAMPQHLPDELKAASPVPPESQPQVAVVCKSKNNLSFDCPQEQAVFLICHES